MTTEPRADLLVRSARSEDDAARLALHEEAFGFRPPAGSFEWKYRTNPHGAAIDLVACSEEEVVGAFALVPRRMRVGAEIRLAFQAADAMVAEAHRGRRVFDALQREANERASRAQAAFLFAFSGRRTQRSFEREGYVSMGDQAIWSRKRLKNARPGWPEKLIAPTEPSLSTLAGVRDPAWWSWRIGQGPTGFHAMRWSPDAEVWAVVERAERLAAISDLGPTTTWIARPQLLSSLCRALDEEGVEEIRITLRKDEGLAALARRAGFRPPRQRSALPFVVRPGTLSIEELKELAGVPRNWWFRDIDRDAEGLLLREAAACPRR